MIIEITNWEWYQVLASKEMRGLLPVLRKQYNPFLDEEGYREYQMAAIVVRRLLRARRFEK